MATFDLYCTGLDINPYIPGNHVWADNETEEKTSYVKPLIVNNYKSGYYPESIFSQFCSKL